MADSTRAGSGITDLRFCALTRMGRWLHYIRHSHLPAARSRRTPRCCVAGCKVGNSDHPCLHRRGFARHESARVTHLQDRTERQDPHNSSAAPPARRTRAPQAPRRRRRCPNRKRQDVARWHRRCGQGRPSAKGPSQNRMSCRPRL